MLMIITLIYSTLVYPYDNHFGSPIDYWGVESPAQQTSAESTKSTNHPNKNLSKTHDDQWKEILDPNNDEFYREGNHIPPKAMLEAVKKPTTENIKKFLAHKKLKEEKFRIFAKKVLEQEQREIQGLFVETPKNTTKLKHPQSFKMRVYYSTNCPYCKKYLPEIEPLNKNGIDIEFVKMNPGAKDIINFPKMRDATEVELKKISRFGVPYTVIADLNKRKTYSIKGFKTKSQVINIIHKLEVKNEI